jgi:hypothetical protein
MTRVLETQLVDNGSIHVPVNLIVLPFSRMQFFSPHGIAVVIAMEPLLSLSKPVSVNLMMQVTVLCT